MVAVWAWAGTHVSHSAIMGKRVKYGTQQAMNAPTITPSCRAAFLSLAKLTPSTRLPPPLPPLLLHAIVRFFLVPLVAVVMVDDVLLELLLDLCICDTVLTRQLLPHFCFLTLFGEGVKGFQECGRVLL